MQGEIEHRVNTLESNHSTFVLELRQTNVTLSKIEKAIEKQNDIHMDIRLLRESYDNHLKSDEESHKRIGARIEKCEDNQSKVIWAILLIVIAEVMKTIIK